MGLFDKLLKHKKPATHVAVVKGNVYSPITGQYIPLEQIPDEVFSQGILGRGCGIEPEEGLVVAPFNGIISQVADTKHAVGVTTEDGAEFLIHVGMDTVEMKGDGFALKVKAGDKVSCGQPLLTFDIAKIRAAGYPATTAFVLTNSDEFPRLVMESGRRFEKTEKIGQWV